VCSWFSAEIKPKEVHLYNKNSSYEVSRIGKVEELILEPSIEEDKIQETESIEDPVTIKNKPKKKKV
jgi:hypothetical protein